MVCPIVCPPIILGGSILSKYLGLDDIIIGLWSGALITTLFLIIISWLDRKKLKFMFRKPLIFFFLFFISYYPLYYFNLIAFTQFIWIFDKFLFGNFIGIIITLSAEYINGYLIKKNNEKVYFKFQKILIPIIFLFFASLLIFIFTKYKLI